MANWSQKKLLVTICGGAAALCAAAAGGVYYTQGLIDEVVVKITGEEQKIAAADAKIAKIPGIEKDVIILRENLDEYVKILPNNKELNEFVRMLNKFERQSGIKNTGLANRSTRAGKGKSLFTPHEVSYDMTATLWQALKFINLVENYERFVSITNFSIQQGKDGSKDQREGEVVHTIKLTMQTFTYNKADGGKEVEIPNYVDRKEELREEIWNRMQAIRIDRYEHKGVQGRRDILVDPRERGDLRVDGPSPAEQRAVLEKYVGEIAKLDEMLKHMRSGEVTLFEQYSLEKRFKNDLGELLGAMEKDATRVTYAPYKLRWSKEVVTPVELLQQQFDNAEAIQVQQADPFLPMAEMELLVAELSSDCNNGLLEQARERFEAVADRINVPSDDPRHELAVMARAWMVKATTALDFKSLDLRLQGVVVNRGGRSGVLLNGEVFEEGDFISDELLVKSVEEEQVWFVFRGLTLVRTM